METIALVQARMGSSRLPNKVMAKLGDRTLIEILLNRLQQAKGIDKIILATSTEPENEVLCDHVKDIGFDVFKGSETNVLDRFYNSCKDHRPKTLLRITGDCPLIDPSIIDEMLEIFKKSDLDYLSNCFPPSFPDGLDVEIFTFEALEKTFNEASSAHELEHATPYMYESSNFRIDTYKSEKDYSTFRWTVDEPEDLKLVKTIIESFSPRIDFSWTEILELHRDRPELIKINEHIIRNEGSKLTSGEKLWSRAKRVIPGGNMLLSKRPDLFLQKGWPTYFSKAEGIKVWDLDGREYKDFSLMGVGTNILGYANEKVDDAVSKTIRDGNMSTLNCAEEVNLAEKLIELNPWSDMVRFARSGGEANAIAVRIARAASGKDKVAVCGYHGWHDWYLSANLKSKDNLSGHLLPGLEPLGVPKSLEGTTIPFLYNDYDSLEHIVLNDEVGVVKMEVYRNEEPKDEFLEKVRNLCNENQVILIFDECTSGFRKTYGGLHSDYGVEPDIAMFGKAMGNGYAITAVVGKKEFMDFAQSSFISSTFWTERIGPTAALATLKEMQRIESWKKITETGSKIKSRWKSLAQNYELNIETFGLDALAGFAFVDDEHLKYKTYLTQEMLKSGYLANNLIYCSILHSNQEIDDYFNALEPIFENLQKCQDGLNIDSILENGPSSSSFKRLN